MKGKILLLFTILALSSMANENLELLNEISPSKNAKIVSGYKTAKEGVQTVFVYDENAMYTVYARVNYLTTIMLQAGETVTFVGGGDTSRWRRATGTTGSSEGTREVIYIKPLYTDLKTNLVINTDKRSYQINLISDKALYNPLVKWDYPQDEFELHPKSWTQDWRCSFFVSKLTREDKIKIYERRKNGETIPSLAKAFNVQESNIKYLIALIKKHGYNILREDKNRVYSKDFKLQTINRILINHESINSVAIDIGLTSSGILDNWLSKFKENGYNVVEKKKGRKPKSMTKLKKNDKTLSEKEKIKQLEEENLYLKAENEYLKKLKALVQEGKLKEKKK